MTRTSTFDLLDAHFFNEVSADYRDLPLMPRFAASRENGLVIDPNYWEKYYPLISNLSFNWKTIKYSSRPNLSKEIDNDDPGIYIFYIQPDNTILGMPKFVIYVGISNENDSNRPLRTRLGDYFLVSKVKKRTALHRLLVKYYEYTYISFSTIKLNTTKIKELETHAIGFFYPLSNKDDFPVDINGPRKAFNIR